MEKFNCIRLDAGVHSFLDWDNEIVSAQEVVDQGLKILWHLDFGLFDKLRFPLSSQQQFQTFRLAIEHFHRHVRDRFIENSIGVLLYEGPLDRIGGVDFAEMEAWATERFEGFDCGEIGGEDPFLRALFCRDIAVDYIKQLAYQMPFGVDCYILPQIISSLSPVRQAIFLNEECYKPLCFLEEKIEIDAKVGICLPPVTHYHPKSHYLLDTTVHRMLSEEIPFRYIDEENFIMQIHGLDEVYVSSEVLSSQGKRKLQGFTAAGGQVYFL